MLVRNLSLPVTAARQRGVDDGAGESKDDGATAETSAGSASGAEAAHAAAGANEVDAPGATGGALCAPSLDSYYDVVDDDGAVLYRSEIAWCTNNPSWLPLEIDDRAHASELSGLRRFVVRVWAAPSLLHGGVQASNLRGAELERFTVAFEQEIELRHLVFVALDLTGGDGGRSGERKGKGLAGMGLNSLLVQCPDGYYASKELYVLLRRTGALPGVADAHDDDDESTVLVQEEVLAGPYLELIKLTTEAREFEEAVERDRQYLKGKIAESQQSVALEYAFTNLKTEVEALHAQRDELLGQLETVSAHVQERRRWLRRRGMRLREQRSRLADAVARQDEAAREAHDENQELRLAYHLLTARQLALVAELARIYPVSGGDGVVLRIRNIPLPDRERDGSDDAREQVSTALGYLAHAISLLSKYLSVPLRYRPEHMASRSVMRDDVLAPGTALPLFGRRRDYDTGMTMLRFDLKQLLHAVGAPTPARGLPLLEHLRALYNHLLGPVMMHIAASPSGSPRKRSVTSSGGAGGPSRSPIGSRVRGSD